jgi:hypothetical protein
MKLFTDEKPDHVIMKVNLLLQKHGLWFEDDGVGEGFKKFELKSVCVCAECKFNRSQR